MKSRKKTALIVITVVVFLVACGIRPDQNVTSSEMVAPEVSSEELLISSLEYLLLDNTGEGAQDQEQQNPQSETQDTLDEEEEPGMEPDEQPHMEEDAMQGEGAVIYYGNGGSSGLEQETVEIAELTPDELIGALARHNIVSLDTKALAFEQGEQDGVPVLYLDLSKSLGGYLRTMSREAESIIVASIINTFLDNYDADAVFLTVEGKPLITSNADYPEMLRRCTPEELMNMPGTSDEEKSGEESGDEANGSV